MRGSSHQRINASSRFLRNPSPLSFTLYISFLCVFSIIIFFNSTRQIVENERQNPLRSEDSTSLKDSDDSIWGAPFSHSLQPCVKPTSQYKAPQNSGHYLTVRSNGGLNQMRTGICDMVAVARLMNATLVIPQLDKKSYWQDSSTFSDIFDELHFIRTLQGDVRIVKELPKELESIPRARKHFMTWSGISYYKNMSGLWEDYKVIHVAKTDSRLANNDLPLDIQRLRCRALYQALRFSPPIESLGKLNWVLSIQNGDTTEAGGAAEITWWEIYCSSFAI